MNKSLALFVFCWAKKKFSQLGSTLWKCINKTALTTDIKCLFRKMSLSSIHRIQKKMVKREVRMKKKSGIKIKSLFAQNDGFF